MLRRAGVLTASLFALVAFAGCDKPAPAGEAKSEAKSTKSDKGAEPAADEAKPGADSSSVLALGEAKIMRDGHSGRAIEIHADGKVNMAGKPFAVLTTTGELSDPQGTLMMSVQPDGSVTGEQGPTGIQISATGGTYTSEDLQLELAFGSEGRLELTATGQNAGLLGSDSPGLVSEGCTGTMTQTCALVALNYLMALGNPDSPRDE